jgi:ribosomal protein S18 acetylase RimI-like enzyme
MSQSSGSANNRHRLNPLTLHKMAANHYALWTSSQSDPWKQQILADLHQRALTDFQMATEAGWAQQRQRLYWESVYPAAAFQCFYWQTPTDVSFAYLDFYHSNQPIPCIRYWSTLNLEVSQERHQLMAWLCQTYASWPMPDLCINIHPEALESKVYPNNLLAQHCLPFRDWLFVSQARHAGSDKLVAMDSPSIALQLERVTANRVFKQYKLAYECYQKKAPELNLVACDYQDLLIAESQQLLLQAYAEDHSPVGLLILEHSHCWGFSHYLIKDKCLYPGFRQQGLGIQLEAKLYQYLQGHGLSIPIMGAILKDNQVSMKCAQRFNRSLWCTEALLPLACIATETQSVNVYRHN